MRTKRHIPDEYGRWNDWVKATERGVVASHLKHRSIRRVLYLQGAPGAQGPSGLLPGYYMSKEKAQAALEVYRIMVGRDPKTGELVK